MTEKKIRVWLTMSVIAVTIILFAFIWAINLNQTEELKNILRMYIIVLGIFVVFAMSLFFMFGEIFDYHGELEKSKVLLMTIIMLLIAQIAFAFTTFTSQQTQFTFKTMELSRKIYDDASKKEIFTLDDNDAIKNYVIPIGYI